MNSSSQFYNHCYKALRRSSLFASLDDKIIQNMLLKFQLETWKRKTPAMDSLNSLDKFYVIISGRMRVCRTNQDSGRELTLALLGPGDVFDVICLLDQREHKVVVTAIDDLEAIYAPIDDVRRWIQQHPELNKTFIPYLARQMRSLEGLATDLAIHDTYTRLARLFLRHTKPDPAHNLQLIHDLSHEELAKMIGSVRMVVNRHLQKLKEEGLVEIHDHHLAVKDWRALLHSTEHHPELK